MIRCNHSPVTLVWSKKRYTLLDYKQIAADLSLGSRQAYEALFKALYVHLCNYAHRMVPDKELAEDIVQHVFITIWEQRASVKQIDSIKSYLYRSVYNACLKTLEKEKVRKRYYDETEYLLLMAQYETFEDTYDESMWQSVLSAIEQLPEKNRQVFEMRFIEGLNTKEVGQMLNITPRTVETHVSKALRILRETLGVVQFSTFFILFYVFKYVVMAVGCS